MLARDVLLPAFDQVRDAVVTAVDGLDEDQLAARLSPRANSVAWLVWHLTRVQDDHVADVAGREQVWTSRGWAARFGMAEDDGRTGYGDSPEQVGAVRASALLLTGYHAEVHAATTDVLRALGDDELDRVVDESYDPPVTLGVRLVSVVGDDLQHAGQAAFARGVLLAR